MAYGKCLFILSLGVLLVAMVIVLPERFDFFLKFLNHTKPSTSTRLFSQEQLANFNGVYQKKLYLAVMGSVFDVTNGKQHYGKGNSYNYFTGKDGSRGLVTGNFDDESETKDHVLDLPCNSLFTLQHWKDTFKQKYKPVGTLIGRYYNENGDETPYTIQLNDRFHKCRLEKELEKEEDRKHPPCNAAWDVDYGTKVWCSKASGGISRNWVGVPRQLYTPGQEEPRCICVNTEDENVGTMFKEYENCPPTSVSCVIKY